MPHGAHGAHGGWPGRLAARVCGLLLVCGLSGCASLGSGVPAADSAALQAAGLPAQVELDETPFFADEGHYCGPAALATSLGAAGVAVRPEALVEQVFVPGRQGSLQIEMLAAARRHGMVSMTIPPRLEALLQETAAGHPVVVLQNLGLSWAPSWHYAVVVGYDLAQGHIVLRSGAMRRQLLSLRTFEYTWQRSGRWAFVTLPAGQLAATVTQEEATRALVAFERVASPEAAQTGYRAALARWPHSASLAMGLGNALYQGGQVQAAADVFAAVAATHQAAAAYNNQAQALLALGRLRDAQTVALQGLAVAGAERPVLIQTLDEIAHATRGGWRASSGAGGAPVP